MLKQKALIDVAGWEQDAEYAVFPQGARAKEALFCPSRSPDNVLKSGKRYLFKRSKGSYPDQFWGEVVAYRIGCLLGLEVPPAFASWNSITGVPAALIEWFYIDGDEVCILAGDYLTRIQADFDREKGSNHNLRDCEVLLRALSAAGILPAEKWKQWWVDALLFDALIGNTDRHQDNWAILFKSRSDTDMPGGLRRGRISPLFDNGTSLGHERFVNRVERWSEVDLNRYIGKGKHHVSWSLDEPKLKGHLKLLEHALIQWPETRPSARARLLFATPETLRESVDDLLELPCVVPLARGRLEFMCRLMERRLELLQDLF